MESRGSLQVWTTIKKVVFFYANFEMERREVFGRKT